jgi:GNAT superfamily N-acetyltransferase
MPNVTIRAAGPADAGALARLRFEFRASVGTAVEGEAAFVARCAKWMSAHLTTSRGWLAWIAEDGNRARGCVWLCLIGKLPNPVEEPEWHGYVSSLYVQSALRGQGVGTALLEAALDECARRGVDAIVLWPTPDSRTLYERHGFRVRDDLLERRGA